MAPGSQVGAGDEAPAVLVTGASSGIGRATVVALAGAGYRVFAGVRQEADGEAVRSAAAGRVTPVCFDLAEPASVAAAAETLDAAVGKSGLYALVNNAGIAVAGPLEFLPPADLRRQFEVNVFGQVELTQRLLPLLRRSAARGRGARLVFVGSISGLVATRLLGAYAASKFALRAVADTFRRELAPWSVGVTLVEPGRVRTPIWAKSRRAGAERVARMPASAGHYYDELQRTLLAAFADAEERAVPAEAVARAVLRAMRARVPRPRYRVGPDALAVALVARWLPDRWLDALLRRMGR